MSCSDAASARKVCDELAALDRAANRTASRSVIAWEGEVEIFENGYIRGNGTCKEFSVVNGQPNARTLSSTETPKGRNVAPDLSTSSVALKSDETVANFWKWLDGKADWNTIRDGASTLLRHNMIAAGRPLPVVSGVSFEGHHIIPLSSFRKMVDVNGVERSILQDAVRWGFNPNAAINGAWVNGSLHKRVVSFFDHPNYSRLVNIAFERLSEDTRYLTVIANNSPIALREISFQLTNEVIGKLNRFIDEAVRTNTPLDILAQQKNFDLITNYP